MERDGRERKVVDERFNWKYVMYETIQLQRLTREISEEDAKGEEDVLSRDLRHHFFFSPPRNFQEVSVV